jgi:hypothetical protein
MPSPNMPPRAEDVLIVRLSETATLSPIVGRINSWVAFSDDIAIGDFISGVGFAEVSWTFTFSNPNVIDFFDHGVQVSTDPQDTYDNGGVYLKSLGETTVSGVSEKGDQVQFTIRVIDPLTTKNTACDLNQQENELTEGNVDWMPDYGKAPYYFSKVDAISIATAAWDFWTTYNAAIASGDTKPLANAFETTAEATPWIDEATRLHRDNLCLYVGTTGGTVKDTQADGGWFGTHPKGVVPVLLFVGIVEELRADGSEVAWNSYRGLNITFLRSGTSWSLLSAAWLP